MILLDAVRFSGRRSRDLGSQVFFDVGVAVFFGARGLLSGSRFFFWDP